MKRRAFLGFLGGAAASGPAMAKAAGEVTIADLSVGSYSSGGEVLYASVSSKDDKSWAKSQLTHLLGKSAEQIAREKRDYYISSLDPDTASLRSVSLGGKIRMQKARSYEMNCKREEERYRGILAGWWD